MEALKDFYTSQAGFFFDYNSGELYRIAERVNGGAIMAEYEYIFKNGFCLTERRKFLSSSDIANLKKYN